MNSFHDNYDLRPFRPGDEENVLGLWETAFKSRMAQARFRWKYLENPYDETMIVCETKQKQIVTFYGGIPYRFQHNGTVDHAVHLMDIMSHPDHRQGKVFISTARHFMSYFGTPGSLLLMYGFPGKAHYAIGEPRLNYRQMAQAAYLKANPATIRQKAPTGDLRVETVSRLSPDDGDWLGLWSDCRGDYPFSMVREPDFVKWRFFDHPEKAYEVLKFIRKSTGTMAGYAVLQHQKEKTTLVDMLARDNREEVTGILGSAAQNLAEKGVAHMDTWLPENHFLARYARETGFEHLPEPLGIVPTVSLFEHSPPLDWVKDHLFYTMGDADLF